MRAVENKSWRLPVNIAPLVAHSSSYAPASPIPARPCVLFNLSNVPSKHILQTTRILWCTSGLHTRIRRELGSVYSGIGENDRVASLLNNPQGFGWNGVFRQDFSAAQLFTTMGIMKAFTASLLGDPRGGVGIPAPPAPPQAPLRRGTMLAHAVVR